MGSVGFFFKKILLLMWKNFILRRRHYCLTAFQLILPILMGILIASLCGFMKRGSDESGMTLRKQHQYDSKQRKNSAKPEIMIPDSRIYDDVYILHAETDNSLLRPLLCHSFQGNPFVASFLLFQVIRKASQLQILYCPNTTAVRNLMSKVNQSLSFDEPKPFNSVEEIENFVIDQSIRYSDQPRLVGVIFSGLSSNVSSQSKISYQVRFAAFGKDVLPLPSTKQLFDPRRLSSGRYLYSGFLGLQVAIDKALIEILTNSSESPNMSIQALPYKDVDVPSRNEKEEQLGDDGCYVSHYFIAMNLMVGILFTVPPLIVNVASEKSTGIKELMKLMGLPSWMHWFGWFLDSMFVLTVILLILLLLLNTRIVSGIPSGIFPKSSTTLWALALLLYFMASTSFCFFISTIFQKQVVAITVGIIVWIATFFVPASIIVQKFRNISFGEMMGLCLMPNTAFYLIITITCNFEKTHDGARWSNIGEPITSTNALSIHHVLIMLLVDTILYMLLTIYLENIFPGEFGLRKPPHYPFLPSSWFCYKYRRVRRVGITPTKDEILKKGFEPEPEYLPIGIDIQKLSKLFDKNKLAVDEVTLKAYDGQITALLGHNGAGKTTTMSMLTGLFAPTSGTAFVNGYDIRTHMREARRSMGLCPQHNMLFDRLTVEEHLTFFGKLKGLKGSETAIEVNFMLQGLQLLEKRNTLSKNISGGQKRKLCLGIALIGGSKIVILDEPTSGMDPEARRAIWDLLLRIRSQCTMLLTTHFMEEADVLGDRIAIMAEGKVRCCGTPIFLKKYFGAGWTLKMTLTNMKRATEVMGLVQKHIAKATFCNTHSGNSSEVSITIPHEGNVNAAFPQLFTELSNAKESMGIKTIGISLTTMDDVFVKVGEEIEAEEQKLQEMKNSEEEKSVKGKSEERNLEQESLKTEIVKSSVKNEASVVGSGAASVKYDENGEMKGMPMIEQNPSKVEIEEIPMEAEKTSKRKRRSGLKLCLQQLYGLLWKRMIYSYRKRNLTIARYITPLLLHILAIYGMESPLQDDAPSEPNLKMTLLSYKNPVTLYMETNTDFGKAYYESTVGPSARLTSSVAATSKSELENDEKSYQENYIVAGEFNMSELTALHSSYASHAPPLTVNLMSNAILRNMSKDSSTEVPRIEVSLQMIVSKFQDVVSARKRAIKKATSSIASFFVPMLIAGMAVFSAAFVVAPVEERQCQAKQLQLMTGVSPLLYWASFFIWDSILAFVLVILMMICFPIFQTNLNFLSYYGGVAIFVELLLYGLATIPMSYVCSLFVKSVGGGFSLVALIHIATGLIISSIVHLVEGVFGPNWFAYALRGIGIWFPTFWAYMGTIQILSNAIKNNFCAILSEAFGLYCTPHGEAINIHQPEFGGCCPQCRNLNYTTCFQPESYLQWTDVDKEPTQAGTLQYLLYIFLSGLLWVALLILIQLRLLKKLVSLMKKTGTTVFLPPSTDEDVESEHERVAAMIQERRVNEDALVVDNLSKNFDSFAAVSGLTFGVHYGECFGLLGVNGAGKTTSFRMLTGDETPTIGNAFAMNCALTESRRQFFSLIGYCPQYDGIVGVLTGAEMLNLFAHLRGVRSVNTESTKWLSRLGLLESGNVQCQKYSGGMKRRLSAAMALIGDPPIILLDEPTSGVDPVARRQFWKVISTVKESEQAVILTSHSMDECEALCGRLGIMVNGQFQCFGGVEHLKQKFAQGFTLTFTFKQMNEAETAEETTLYEDIKAKFYPCTLKDQHGTMVQYHVLNTAMSWGQIFTLTEELKSKYPDLIEDYTVKETTLEEVFLSFARMQYPERKAEGGGTWFNYLCCKKSKNRNQDIVYLNIQTNSQTQNPIVN